MLSPIPRLRVLPWLAALALSAPVVASPDPVDPVHPVDPAQADFTELSLEELLNIDVRATSVSRKAESVSRSAAAIFVITAEDIRRSGVNTIPDAVRLAPGMHVAELQSGAWAVSARGFAAQFADKMLVLIDGRSVYTQLFAGVFWDSTQVPLENVERIEIIRGPGATLWGANAVNGVINIITRSAEETHGPLSSLRASNGGIQGMSQVGGTLEDGTHYRAYARGLYRATNEPTGSGAGLVDDLRFAQTGFRMDRSTDEETVTVQGDAYYGYTRAPFSRPGATPGPNVTQVEQTALRGLNLLARWSRELEDGSHLTLQGYYDGNTRDAAIFEEGRDTLDFELQHRFQPLEDHELVWGFGYRMTSSLIDSSPIIDLDPNERTDQWFSAFVQDEISLIGDELVATLGTKLSHNDYTQFEIQPNARMLWAPDDTHVVWGAVSRAVQTPSQSVDDADIESQFINVGGFPTHFRLKGSNAVEAEELVAYELGYRARISEDVSVDAAAFLNDYDELKTTELGALFADPNNPGEFIQELNFDNKSEARSWGLELAGQWNVRPDWRLHAGYSFLEIDLDFDAGSTDPQQTREDLRAPSNQFHVRSYWNVSEDAEVDTSIWWVDGLDAGVPSYLRTDVRLGWRPSDDLEVSVGVRGLFHDGELEFDTGFFGDISETQTEYYVNLTWQPKSESSDDGLVRADW